jgi:hypothetical protein
VTQSEALSTHNNVVVTIAATISDDEKQEEEHFVKENKGSDQNTLMEDLFERTSRFRSLLHEENVTDDAQYVEVVLRQGASLDGSTWTEFMAFKAAKDFLWYNNVVFLDVSDDHKGYLTNYDQAFLEVETLDHHNSVLDIFVAPDAPRETVSHALDALFRMLTRSRVPKVKLTDSSLRRHICPVSQGVLSRFLTENEQLERLTLRGVTLDATHFYALDQARAAVDENDNNETAVIRRNFEIDLSRCKTTRAGGDALLESLARNRGPTRISLDIIDGRRPELVQAIKGNRSLHKLVVRGAGTQTESEIAHIVEALAENRGLEVVRFARDTLSDGNWGTLCQSLAKHPALEKLDIAGAIRRDFDEEEHTAWSNEIMLQRARTIADMVKVNTVMHTILVGHWECDKEVMRKEVEPRLDVNLYRPRIKALKTAPTEVRPQLVGRALAASSVAGKIGFSTRRWMILSGNVDAIFGECWAPPRVVELN